jgi:ATP-dependent DNA helicase DinG
MLHSYHGQIRNIACLYAHSGPAEDDGNRIYEVAAAVVAPDRPEEIFTSPVRYGKTTERERYASGLSREVLRKAPPLADVTAFLAVFLRESNILLTLNAREELTALLAGCGNPRVVDLVFSAEFFLPAAENLSLKTLWEHLNGKPRERISFTAREAVDLSYDLVRHICGRVLNPEEFPPAAALRFHLGKSGTLFGDLFLHITHHYRDYFGGLFDPSAGGETPDWKRFLEKAPPPAPLPDCGEKRKTIPLARIEDLYRGLAASAKGYAVRPSQIAYAGHVAAALNDCAVLTVEAGTGTGKTQGYLIPVMEFLRRNPQARVAVSTYTKSLQEQIIRREIPLTLSLNRAYRKIPTVLLKGKSNDLCAEKLDHIYDETLSGSQLLAWLYFVSRLFHFRKADGDAVGERIRIHLHDGFFFRRLQHEISAKSGCTRKHLCCPAQVISAEAINARLIVTNHHKLALLNRDETLGLLFSNYIIDEANHFEQAVRSAFGIELSSREIADTLTALESILRRLTPMTDTFPAREIQAAMNALNDLRRESAELTRILAAIRADAAQSEATVLPAEHPAFENGRLKTHLDALRKDLKKIVECLSFAKDGAACRQLGIRPRTGNRLKTALKDLRDQAETLKTIGEKSLSPNNITTCTLFVLHWKISVRTVEVGDLLRDHIYEGRDCVVFTSATLRQGESFDGFRLAAGMMPVREPVTVPTSESPENEDAKDSAMVPEKREYRFEAIPSPFSPDAATITVAPEALSGAFECKEAWLARIAELLPNLIRRNRGRTLVLFASYMDLTVTAGRVAKEIHGDGYPLLIQQNGIPTTALCDEFRAIRESVLFAVDTFWYGVDFPGDTLTQVIITRLPFPHLQDPLQIARRNLLSREEYWRRYYYETEIKLRQGIGRLIRSEADRGRVVILDARYRRQETRGGDS